jgi:thiol-disulfide isomerase/thioredoxin
MKHVALTSVLSIGVATLLLIPDAEASLSLGQKAPKSATKMKSVDGRELTITEAGGEKGTLVIFTCNHCPYVKAWEERIVELGNTYRDRGVGVIAINPNDPSVKSEDRFEAMQERAKARGMKFPYTVDETSAIARAFGATKTPEIFLFDAGGKLVYKGAVDDNSEDASKVKHHYLRDALEALIAGKPIAKAETKALGCGIKFRS